MGILDHITSLPRKRYAGQEATVRTNMEQRTSSKLGKECTKAVYCCLVYLTSMQGTSCEMPAWMNHKLESRFPGEISITSDMQMTSRLPGEISITSDMQMTPPLWQKVKN